MLLQILCFFFSNSQTRKASLSDSEMRDERTRPMDPRCVLIVLRSTFYGGGGGGGSGGGSVGGDRGILWNDFLLKDRTIFVFIEKT